MTKQEQIDLEAKYSALFKEQIKFKSKLKTIRGMARVLELLYHDNKLDDDFREEKDTVIRMLISAIENDTLLPVPGFKY